MLHLLPVSGNIISKVKVESNDKRRSKLQLYRYMYDCTSTYSCVKIVLNNSSMLLKIKCIKDNQGARQLAFIILML